MTGKRFMITLTKYRFVFSLTFPKRKERVNKYNIIMTRFELNNQLFDNVI
jgi:hypothetical protein